MVGPTPHRIAQGVVGVLIVIVLRALGELLRVDACGATGLTSEGKLYVTGRWPRQPPRWSPSHCMP